MSPPNPHISLPSESDITQSSNALRNTGTGADFVGFACPCFAQMQATLRGADPASPANLLGVTNDVDDFNTHPIAGKASAAIQAVCNWYGPTDFLRMNDVPGRIDHHAPDSPESLFLGGPIQENKDLARKANPITYVSPSDPPMLIMHGDKDAAVIFNQSELLAAALEKAGVPHRLHKVVNGGHGFGGADESREALFERVLRFFNEELK